MKFLISPVSDNLSRQSEMNNTSCIAQKQFKRYINKFYNSFILISPKLTLQYQLELN